MGPFCLIKPRFSGSLLRYRNHPFWREFVVYGDDTKIVALFDYLVFAMANAELLVPKHAGVVKANVNSTLIGLLV